jgi:murein DD-endopeptidase MepM/ murein hydrolase activator NlpD
MQNNGKFFTFLLSHSSKSKIYIRRVEVSKKFLQNGLLSLALIIGVSAFGGGVYGVFNYTISANSDIALNLINPAAALLTANPAPNSSIDYSRPEASSYAINSGGPLQAINLDLADAEVEKELRTIQIGGNAAFLPSIWAHAGKINNEFGFRRNPFGGRTYEFHAGMDIDGERGDIVVAPANGTVTKAGWQGGYGQMIEIDHGNGLVTRYGHLSKIEVEVGDTITRGQLMGLIGSSGRSTGPHLHYELRFRDKPINPRRFLPPEPTELTKVAG